MLISLMAFAFSANAFASTLRVSVDHHLSTYGPVNAVKTVRAAFTNEPLLADVRLDVYAVPQLPSSREHRDALRALPAEGWWKKLDWQLVDAKTGRAVPSAQWRLVSSRAEMSGPSTGDTTRTVDVRSLVARFELSRALEPGDYRLVATIDGLASQPFLFAVRTGREPDVRDAYLATNAARTTDYATYRALQLERVKNNPTNAAAYLELADRAIEQGTLAETQQYLDGALGAMNRLLQQNEASHPEWVKQQKAAWEPRATRIRALQRALPDVFEHRSEWRVTTDPATGDYVIRSRRDDRLVRSLATR